MRRFAENSVCACLGIAFLSLLAFTAIAGIATPVGSGNQHDPELVLVSQQESPVLTTRSPDAADIKYGFEGGRVVKLGNIYHLFTSEMVGDPIWVKMSLGYWRSEDRLHWHRVRTLFTSTGEYTGKDPRASLWSPLPVYDDRTARWNLFYVAYRSAPNTPTQFLSNCNGEIWRAESTEPGADGIGGPYKDVGVILHPGPESESWEGLQGTDSFFPYRVGEHWYALYGSARTEKLPIEYWRVGLASAPDVSGPGPRVPGVNPLPIERVFIENPIVTSLPGGGFICVYDSNVADAIGYAYSPDGVHWNPGKALVIQPKRRRWARDVRTPLGLVPEGNDQYTLFYTGFEQNPNWPGLMAGKPTSTCAVGLATVRIVYRSR